mmetsp:Transcript_28996/g.42605  ORF Transcript_28996/g.42605 Transcript_28996/m.42605 type:complete len:400 (-) Transcript_28996:249-1448(-)
MHLTNIESCCSSSSHHNSIMKIKLGSKKKSLFLFGLLLGGGKQCHAEVHYLKVVEGDLLEGGIIVMDPDSILPMPLSTLGDNVELSIPHPPADSCDESTIRRNRLLKGQQSSNKFLDKNNNNNHHEETISLPSRDSFQQRRTGDVVLPPRHPRVLKKGSSNSKGSDKGGKKGGSGFKIKFEKNLPGITDVVPEDKYEDTPYKQTGRLFLGNFVDGRLNVLSWCSASVVGPDILMTAAHCFFDADDLEFLWEGAIFCPQEIGNFGSCPKGGYFVTLVIPVDEFLLGGNAAFNVAFGKLTGEVLFSSDGPSVNDVTGQGFKLLGAEKESETLTLGYPANIEGGLAMIESLDENFFLDFSINGGLDSYPIMAFGSEMQFGASGGPVLTEKGAIGVLSFIPSP